LVETQRDRELRVSTASAPAATFAPDRTTADHRAVAIWLLVCAAMIFMMVVLGGITRLT
jgi:cytochrome c oxidase assembly protein subunit 15